MCFSRGDTKLSQPIGSEDLAIWLLISTVPYPEFQQGYQSVDWQTNSVGSWRLALLVKNMVVMGSPLDMRYFQIFISTVSKGPAVLLNY